VYCTGPGLERCTILVPVVPARECFGIPAGSQDCLWCVCDGVLNGGPDYLVPARLVPGAIPADWCPRLAPAPCVNVGDRALARTSPSRTFIGHTKLTC
jgi:hypothetical protein